MSKILGFLAEVRQVFFQISWPKREALIQLSVVVISISIVVASILGGFDYLFTNTVGILTNLPNQKSTTQIVQPTSAPAASASATPIVTLKPTIKPTKSIKK